MSEASLALSGDALKLGLLMESAHAQQKLAETQLGQLQAHIQELDGVVRDEIRRTLINEIKGLTAEIDHAVTTLRGVKRAVQLRSFAWNVATALLCIAGLSVATRHALPSPTEIDVMRRLRDELAQDVSQWEQRGGRAQWRNCGAAARLCVRVDKSTPAYGDQADYYIVRGY